MDLHKDTAENMNLNSFKSLNNNLSNNQGDQSERQILLDYYLEMFNGRLDPDVISIVLNESGDTDKALENLFTLAEMNEESERNGENEFNEKLLTKPSFSEMLKKNSDNLIAQKQQQEQTQLRNLTAATRTMKVNKLSNEKQSECDKVNELIKLNKKVMVIMRGLPGSGKSTLAHNLVRCTNGKVLTTDDYFTSRNGIFQFDWTKLDDAHKWNQKRTLDACVNNVTPIVIDNTNLQLWEMLPYAKMANEHGYEIRLLEPETTWKYKTNYLAKANKHNVAKEKIDRMLDRFERNLTVNDLLNAVKVNNTNSVVSCSSSTRSVQIPQSNSNFIGVSANVDKQVKVAAPVVEGCGFWDTGCVSKKKTNEFNALSSSPFHSLLSEKYIQSSVLQDDQSPKPQRAGVRKNRNNDSTSEDKSSNDQNEFLFGADNINICLNEKSNSSNALNTIDNTIVNDNGNNNNNGNGNSRKLLKLAKVNNGNWEFPAFPNLIGENKVCDNDDSNDQRFIHYICSSSQTESKDWALLESKQNDNLIEDLQNLNLNEKFLNLDIITLPNSSRNLSTRAIRFDRGSSTSDFSGVFSFEQKLEHLKKDFPRIQDSHLSEVLQSCHEDMQWAKNLLTEFSEDHYFDLRSSDYSSPSNSPPLSPPPLRKPFTLKLDKEFCMQLQNAFGENGGDEFNFNVESGDQMIELNAGVAKLIFHIWKQTWKKDEKPQQLPNGNGKHNKNKSVSKQVMEKKLDLEMPNSKFKEIMDLEMALKLSWDDYYSVESGEATEDEEFISTTLKRKQLYESFPGLDRQILDNIFDASQHKLNEAITTIGQSLGVSASLSEQTEVWVAAEIVQRSKANEVAKEAEEIVSSKSENLIEEIGQHCFGDIRSEMFKLISRRKEYLDKARSSYHQKNFAVASYYSTQARDYLKEINSMSNDIVDLVIKSHSSNKLDLHGLHQAEVLLTVSAFLSLKMEEMRRKKYNRMILEIVTGWGAHSRTAPKIKPIVLNYLATKHYKFEVSNPGTIQVILTN